MLSMNARDDAQPAVAVGQNMRLILAFFTCLILAACGRATSELHPGADQLNGRWARVPFEGEPPGSGLTIELTTNGSSINGTGSWHGEAGPSGSIAATGHLVGNDQVTLDITLIQLVNGVEQGRSTERFDGRLTSRTDLEGTTTVNGLTGTLHLRKSTTTAS